MTTTADITAAEARLTAAQAEVDRLRAVLAAELTDRNALGEDSQRLAAEQEGTPRRLGWSDGVAEARARYPKGKGTGVAAGAARDGDTEEVPGSTAAAGREEARRRAALRA
jgi:hypothetical protein